jgi:hypothetical protein
MKGDKAMASSHHGDAVSSIEPTDVAQEAVSDTAKAEAAEAEAAAAAEAVKNAPNERFIEYVVPRRATATYVDEHGKRRALATRPSSTHEHASRSSQPSYASRVGVANARAQISPADWAAVGVAAKNDDKLVWDFANNWRIPASQLSPEQIRYLLVDDRGHNGLRFELVDGQGNKVDS